MKHMVTESCIESIHRYAEGLVAYVRCNAGHMVIHEFVEADRTVASSSEAGPIAWVQ